MVSSVNSPSGAKWMSYLADNALLDVGVDVDDPQAPGPFFWYNNNQNVPEQAECSVEGNGVKTETTDEGVEKENSGSRKRIRDDASKDAGNKANREKMRRDRLNDRFVELSQALDPGRPPKTDKATILCDAVRVLGQLRSEAQQLKEGNSQLREQIKELKVEKNELRDEKSRLKSEKARLEHQVKAMSLPPGYMPHPAAMQAAAAAFAAQAQSQAAHVAAKPAHTYPSMAMWQWMPPASLDTSQDHVRHPPVA